jgi:hypothetical protein
MSSLKRYVADPQSLRKVDFDTPMSPWDTLVTPYDEAIAAEASAKSDALAKAVERFRESFDCLNYEHLFDPDNCECVWCEDGAILIAAIRGVKYEREPKGGSNE